MANRPLMLATLLGASIGVPYVVSQSNSGPKAVTPAPPVNPFLAGQPTLVSNSNIPMPPPLLTGPPPRPAAPTLAVPSLGAPTVEVAKAHTLPEVLRFDLTREWVYGNWPRKSTGLADPDMYGIRVPLVTGTALTDLAGSLTYSFNQQGQVQHITFVGRTADTTQLVHFVTTTYQLERREAPAGEQLYQVGSDDQVTSELRTRPESVLWSNALHGSFVVELELERPGSNRYLPPRTPKLAIPPAQAQAAGPNGAAANSPPAAGAAGQGAPESSYYEQIKHATYDSIRHATPAEDNHVQWKRWPN